MGAIFIAVGRYSGIEPGGIWRRSGAW